MGVAGHYVTEHDKWAWLGIMPLSMVNGCGWGGHINAKYRPNIVLV